MADPSLGRGAMPPPAAPLSMLQKIPYLARAHPSSLKKYEEVPNATIKQLGLLHVHSWQVCRRCLGTSYSPRRVPGHFSKPQLHLHWVADHGLCYDKVDEEAGLCTDDATLEDFGEHPELFPSAVRVGTSWEWESKGGTVCILGTDKALSSKSTSLARVLVSDSTLWFPW